MQSGAAVHGPPRKDVTSTTDSVAILQQVVCAWHKTLAKMVPCERKCWLSKMNMRHRRILELGEVHIKVTGKKVWALSLPTSAIAKGLELPFSFPILLRGLSHSTR
jgi:hypothetical protein